MRARSLLIAAGLAVVPVAPLLAVTPAHALLAGHTVCYDDSGHAVMDPPNPDDYANCLTRPGGGGTTTGGGGKPVLCTITASGMTCVPYLPLQP
jgi:hypothetical protein